MFDFQRFACFIGGGGVNPAKVSCGANPLFLKKKKFLSRLKKKIKKKKNYIYVCVYGKLYIYSLLYYIGYLYII